MFAISQNISLNLPTPICGIRFGSPGPSRATVSVPETAMHKHSLSPCGEYQVWFTGEVSPVQSKSISEAMHQGAHNQFGRGVFAPHATHNPTTDALRKNVHYLKLTRRTSLEGITAPSRIRFASGAKRWRARYRETGTATASPMALYPSLYEPGIL